MGFKRLYSVYKVLSDVDKATKSISCIRESRQLHLFPEAKAGLALLTVAAKYDVRGAPTTSKASKGFNDEH